MSSPHVVGWKWAEYETEAPSAGTTTRRAPSAYEAAVVAYRGDGLEVRRVCEKGYGLFTTVDRRRRELIAPMFGKVVDKKDGGKRDEVLSTHWLSVQGLVFLSGSVSIYAYLVHCSQVRKVCCVLHYLCRT